MPMTHAELRALCNRFFDAYQDQVIENVAAAISDDFEVWLAPYNKTVQREEWLQTTVPGWARNRSRKYNDRKIDTFEGGWVARYTLSITEHCGRKSSLQVCVIALCRNGKIYRMDEYIDPSKSPAWVERQKQLAQEVTTATKLT